MKTKFLLIVSLFASCGLAWAQTACPNGVPPGSPQCGPSPTYHGVTPTPSVPRPPTPKWATRWGAIAIDDPNSIAGAVVGKRSKRQAEKSAIAECKARGGWDCHVRIAYRDQCAVIVWGKKKYSTASAATKEQAVQIGMQICNAGDIDCQVYYEDCSLPVRIQ